MIADNKLQLIYDRGDTKKKHRLSRKRYPFSRVNAYGIQKHVCFHELNIDLLIY